MIRTHYMVVVWTLGVSLSIWGASEGDGWIKIVQPGEASEKTTSEGEETFPPRIVEGEQPWRYWKEQVGTKRKNRASGRTSRNANGQDLVKRHKVEVQALQIALANAQSTIKILRDEKAELMSQLQESLRQAVRTSTLLQKTRNKAILANVALAEVRQDIGQAVCSSDMLEPADHQALASTYNNDDVDGFKQKMIEILEKGQSNARPAWNNAQAGFENISESLADVVTTIQGYLKN